MNIRVPGLMLAGLLASVPAWSVSTTTTGPAQPLPDVGATPVALPIAAEALTAGSSALVPLVAAEVPASQDIALEASLPTGSAAKGRPIDDITFLARAAESGRQEAQSARDALPQLHDPDLRRVAESLANDRGDANVKLTKLAEAKLWPVPQTAPAGALPTGTASPDFDAKWTTDMISAHERALVLYRAQAQGGEDKDLRQYARDTIPTIQHHLAELRRLQK
jgi:putative membrane protein